MKLQAPENFDIKLEKQTLNINESVKIQTKLLNEQGKTDTYLRRYYDESLITRSSNNEYIATVDEYGVIHGLHEGNCVIYYGDKNIDISVTGDICNVPSSNSLSLTSSGDLNLLDYDYVFESGENSDEYSALVYGSFTDDSLEDKKLSWELSDNLKAKLAPYKYDNEGFPIYHDDDNRGCIRVCGYRHKGDVTLTCYSNSDHSIFNTITLNVDEALPSSMTLNVKDKESLKVNDQKTLTASFNPKNVNNRRIHVEVSNSSVIEVVNNDNSSVIIKAIKVGTAHIVVNSAADPSFKVEFDVETTAKSFINEDNYGDFHTFIRKNIGHLGIFLVTAIAGFIFFYTLINNKKKLWLTISLTLLCGFFVAGLSELIQYFIPTRSGLWSDVGIDYIGYAIGTLLSLTVALLILLIKRIKINKSNIKEK